jgi:hypothetical protein
MDSELSDACVKAVQKATKPITLSEIGAACLGCSKPNAKLVASTPTRACGQLLFCTAHDRVEVLKQLAGRAVIHQWPTYRRSQIFDRRRFEMQSKTRLWPLSTMHR